MPLINYTKVYRDRVMALLEPGEDLRMVAHFGLAFGDDDDLELPYDHQGFGERYATRKLGPKLVVREQQSRHLIVGMGLFGLIWNPRITSAIIRFLVAPLQAAGGPESMAARFMIALKQSDDSSMCAVTDRRLVVLNHTRPKPGAPPRASFSVVTAVTRDDVADVRRAGRLWLFPQRGRVLITFTDQSQVATLTGLVSTGTAKAIVAALTG